MRGRDVKEAAEKSAPGGAPVCGGCDCAVDKLSLNPGIVRGRPKRSGSCRATASHTHHMPPHTRTCTFPSNHASPAAGKLCVFDHCRRLLASTNNGCAVDANACNVPRESNAANMMQSVSTRGHCMCALIPFKNIGDNDALLACDVATKLHKTVAPGPTTNT